MYVFFKSACKGGLGGLEREVSALKNQNMERDVNSVKNVTRRILYEVVMQ